MALGKAYIEVHADTKPFARELGRELERIVRAADKTVKVSARKTGSSIADGAAEGVKKDSKKLKRAVNNAVNDSLFGDSILSKGLKGLIDTIDDGISGLPDEIKVVLGGALVALIPVIVAFGGVLGAALVSGFSLALAGGLAALVGSQIPAVENSFANLVDSIQSQFANATSWLAEPILAALDLINGRFAGILPNIAALAQQSVTALAPLIDALFGLVEEALPGIAKGFSGIDRFFLPLQVGFRNIGDAIGRLFNNVLNNPEAPAALYSILGVVEDLIIFLTDLVTIGLAVYGVFRRIGEALGIVEPLATELNGLAQDYGIAADGAAGFGYAVDTTINPLTDQDELLDGINKELETYTNLMFKSVENQLDFQQQIIQLSESVKENGKSLDITTKAGQANARILLQMAHNAVETRKTQIELTGDVENSQIEFEKQRQKIYEVAHQMGLSDAATKNLIGSLLSIPPPKDTGVNQGSINRLITLEELLDRLKVKLQPLFGNLARAGAAAVNAVPHADGGVFNNPHVGMVAEAGPEAIIPLNKPARAAQVISQAGLAGMMSPSVNVYIGNRQIDAYIDDRVSSAMRAASRSLSYGTRTV